MTGQGQGQGPGQEQRNGLEPGLERIAVVGGEGFAEDVAQAVAALADLRLVGKVGPREQLPDGTGLVLCLAEPHERVEVIQRAVEGGLPVVTLPLAETGDAARTLLREGRVAQVSGLRGFPALETLRLEMHRGALGSPYGLFATHRVKQGGRELFEQIGVPLLHYVYGLAGAPARVAQTTRTALRGTGGEPNAWFVIAQTGGGPMLTVEFGAILPAESPQAEEILVEATGSDAVLRAEPTRQSVVVSGRTGSTSRPWWSSTGPGYLAAALGAIQAHDPARELGFLDLLGAVYRSIEAGQPAMVG